MCHCPYLRRAPRGRFWVLALGLSLLTALWFGPASAAATATAVAGTWAATGDLITGRAGHTATRLSDGRVLAAGGDSGPTATTEVYDLANDAVRGAVVSIIIQLLFD